MGVTGLQWTPLGLEWTGASTGDEAFDSCYYVSRTRSLPEARVTELLDLRTRTALLREAAVNWQQVDQHLVVWCSIDADWQVFDQMQVWPKLDASKLDALAKAALRIAGTYENSAL